MLFLRDGYEYHYYHKDHLGNIRQVFRAESTTTYMATMEPENETQEMQQFFHNLSDSRSIDARYNQTEGGRAVAYLDASRGRDYGPVWSKELAQGDSLHAAVLGMLYDPKEKPKLKEVLTGIGRQNTLRSGLEGANLTGTSSLGLQPLWLALQLARQLEKVPLPESYLGYILYDKDSIRYDSGRVEISRQAFTNPEELALDITATKGGFVEVYVYNSSASPVWYDQFSISSSQAVIIQENHYYPFGMQIAGLELDLGSRNRYLYNGKELQDDHNLDWHDYGARMYDAQIGRWHVVDPMTENGKSWSPYNYAFDNPIRFIDPDGRWPDLPGSLTGILDKAKSQLVNLVSQKVENVVANAVESVKDAISNLEPSIYAEGEAKLNAQVGGSIEIKGIGVQGNAIGSELLNLTIGGRVDLKSGEMINETSFTTAGNNESKKNSGGSLEFFGGVNHETETLTKSDGSNYVTKTTMVSAGSPIYGGVHATVATSNDNVSVRSGYTNHASIGLFLVPSVSINLGVELKSKKN